MDIGDQLGRCISGFTARPPLSTAPPSCSAPPRRSSGGGRSPGAAAPHQLPRQERAARPPLPCAPGCAHATRRRGPATPALHPSLRSAPLGRSSQRNPRPPSAQRRASTHRRASARRQRRVRAPPRALPPVSSSRRIGQGGLFATGLPLRGRDNCHRPPPRAPGAAAAISLASSPRRRSREAAWKVRPAAVPGPTPPHAPLGAPRGPASFSAPSPSFASHAPPPPPPPSAQALQQHQGQPKAPPQWLEHKRHRCLPARGAPRASPPQPCASPGGHTSTDRPHAPRPRWPLSPSCPYHLPP
mmetsp:Transcript_110896/g.236870  ORF Transcript_110896/g.236870 Transcript_110896/m.236870 type:complete len:300 (+) Transcript_110896:2-901(+)